MVNKFIICSIISISTAYSAVTTTLNLPAPPTKENMYKAIAYIKRAAKDQDIQKNLDKARSAISMTTKKEVYNAAVYINGNKQFNNRGDNIPSWNFSGYCYKGEVAEAVRLINKAIELNFWDSDEEWIDSASVNGKQITLVIQDGPNEYSWLEHFGACK